jgi:sulfatase maturation enzyme AslB (radical SAM superfamily)
MKTYFFGVWSTNGCNLRCKYCFYEGSSLWEQQEQFMTKEVADAVISRIESGAIEGVSFFGGEPMYNWDILEYIISNTNLPEKYKKGKFWFITTNGTLFTPERIEFLKGHNVHINLSFDGIKESQDYWRDNSYEQVMRNLYLFVTYPNIQILKTLSSVDNLYEDIKHIKDLGFKAVFINMLEPFGHITHEGVDPEFFKQEYKRTIQDLHDPPTFTIGDYQRWTDLLKKERQSIGCGYSNRGLGVRWDGKLFPCHEGPSLPDEFAIGDLWDWIDPEKEKKIRNVPNSPCCEECAYKMTKCYVSMYHKHGKFGVPPPRWAMEMEKAKIDVIEELNDLISKPRRCDGISFSEGATEVAVTPKGKSLLIAIPVSADKYYLMKPFFESLVQLEVPINTDIIFIVDDDSTRLRLHLRRAVVGEAFKIPNIGSKFRNIDILPMPTVHMENFMYRIARARNIAMGIAREKKYDAIFFLDFDILVESDGLRKLIETDADIVGGLVKCRRPSKEGWFNIYKRKPEGGIDTIRDFQTGDIIDIDATGHDCILINKQCFDENYEYKPEVPEAEDMGFCFRNKDKGRKIVINTGVITKHIDVPDIIIGDKV